MQQQQRVLTVQEQSRAYADKVSDAVAKKLEQAIASSAEEMTRRMEFMDERTKNTIHARYGALEKTIGAHETILEGINTDITKHVEHEETFKVQCRQNVTALRGMLEKAAQEIVDIGGTTTM